MSGRISRSSPLHPDKEAFNDDWNEFNDLGHSANKFRPIGSNIRSVSCSSVEYPFGFLFVGRISVRFPVRRHCTATRTPSTTTRRSAITSIIPLTNSEHPTRLLGRISVRVPVRRPCTATMEAFRSLSGTSDGELSVRLLCGPELTGPAQAVLLHLALIGPPLSQPQKVLPRSNNLGGILVFVRPLTDVCYRSFKPRQR
ncbi:hypothetical protein C8R46DRAFT_1030566 [Mycena filopes]|nr:hypothetical protein C8R46DRAFT_1030566 [Mycena filopes]